MNLNVLWVFHTVTYFNFQILISKKTAVLTGYTSYGVYITIPVL